MHHARYLTAVTISRQAVLSARHSLSDVGSHLSHPILTQAPTSSYPASSCSLSNRFKTLLLFALIS